MLIFESYALFIILLLKTLADSMVVLLAGGMSALQKLQLLRLTPHQKLASRTSRLPQPASANMLQAQTAISLESSDTTSSTWLRASPLRETAVLVMSHKRRGPLALTIQLTENRTGR